MGNKKLENMSDAELMEAWTALGERVSSDRERLKEFSREHQKRERLRGLGITAADLELLQSATPDQINSEETVMTGEGN